MSLAEHSAILATTAQPFSADFAGARFIQLYLYAHRVDGLQPGVYRLWPERAELEQTKSGDQHVAAAGLSLGQDLAGNACVTSSMIGDLERAVSCPSQALNPDDCLVLCCITALAPCTNSLRRYWFPRRGIFHNVCLPPVECSSGTTPRQKS